MMNDNFFLAFKGLKFYNPVKGWKNIEINNSNEDDENLCRPNESAKVGEGDSEGLICDPLMKDLFERLCLDSSDPLAVIWSEISDEIDLFQQYLTAKKNLVDQIGLIDQEINSLHEAIITHLDEAQELAIQQISTVNLRVKISAVAKSRLLVKFKKLNKTVAEQSPYRVRVAETEKL